MAVRCLPVSGRLPLPPPASITVTSSTGRRRAASAAQYRQATEQEDDEYEGRPVGQSQGSARHRPAQQQQPQQISLL